MWVVPLNATTPETETAERHVGGKAAGISRLIRAGFRVPDSYSLTTKVYEDTLRRALISCKSPEKMAAVVRGIDLPPEIDKKLRHHHEDVFNGSPVAVRSSATSEDGERLSFAGQLDTLLNVSGTDDVIAAVRAVWASFFNRANLLYRGRVSLDDRPPLVGVVVQRMIQPRVAGVMFTADPVSGDSQRLVISVSQGLGDAVVEGRSSETIYVHAPTREVLQIGETSPSRDLLSKADLDSLIEAAERLNETFGQPQDVEWAIDEDGLAFLQSRPITAGRRQGGARGPTVWTNANVGEALPGVATPMTWSIIRSFSRRGFESAFGALGLKVPKEYELVSSFRGRIYLNLSEFASVFSQVPFFKIASLLKVAGAGEAEEVEKWGYERHSKAGFLAKLPITMSRMALSQISTPWRARRWEKKFRHYLDRFRLMDLTSMSYPELLELLHELDAKFDKTGIVMLTCGSNFLGSYLVTQQLLRRWGGDQAAAKEHHLFTGLKGLASADPGLELMEMARFTKEHPALLHAFSHLPSEEILDRLEESAAGRELQNLLKEFLRRYGHRGAGEAELATPRWAETPSFLIDVIRSHLEAPYVPPSADLEDRQATMRQENTELIRQYFRPGFGLAFRWILGRTQENARLREGTRACVTDTLGMYRRFFLEVGKRLVGQRALAEAEDVFFLTRTEVEQYLEHGIGTNEMALTIATRRAEFVAFGESPDPPDTFVLDANDPIPEEEHLIPADTPFLDGLPASPGRVTGRARVIRDLTAEAHLHPGEVLIAPFTDVGWTPLFLVASGIVTDMGGPLSHAAVVAREYGVAAVVNTKEATSFIKTGDLVTVDGDAGRVYLQA